MACFVVDIDEEIWWHDWAFLSLRGCHHCVGTMLLILDLGCRIPSHNSIRNWLCKSGQERVKISQGKGGVYVIYVDENWVVYQM
jgi:hypothetical protein